MTRGGRVQLLLVAVNVAFWGAILGWTVVADHGPPPDYLDDRTFPEVAEPRCAAAMAELATLGDPSAVGSIEERARLVGRQDAVLRSMVADLRAVPRPGGEEGEWVAAWLADWEVHIDDRQRWAARLHAGSDPPFVETARGNEQVSAVIDAFAEVNDMPSCATPGDV